MKTIFYTWLSDDFKDTIIDYQGFYRSFKYFHPEVDLKIFGDKEIAEVFGSESWIMHSTCMAAFAKKLYKNYDLVVHVDSDFYFFDRCHEILEGDYDIAACSNYNVFLNVDIKEQEIDGIYVPRVGPVHYMQGALVASTKPEFWDDYYDITSKIGHKMPLYENDTFNVLWHSGRYKTKLLDGDYDFRSPHFKQYYNCASLGRENQFQLVNNQVMLDQKPVRSYHVAHGNQGASGRRKLRLHQLFNHEINHWFNRTIMNTHA